MKSATVFTLNIQVVLFIPETKTHSVLHMYDQHHCQKIKHNYTSNHCGIMPRLNSRVAQDCFLLLRTIGTIKSKKMNE